MAVTLPRLPRFLVLEPVSTVRIEIELESPACEIDVELENPQPGRSFVLLIGHKEGPFVQRVRLAGRARILFDPEAPGEYVLLLANPHREPLVLRLKGRNLPKGAFPPKGPTTRPLLEVPKEEAARSRGTPTPKRPAPSPKHRGRTPRRARGKGRAGRAAASPSSDKGHP
jgi:hypothetical protein